MKPEDFMTDDMTADLHGYNVRSDDSIVVVVEIESDCYIGNIELTKQEVEDALQHAVINNLGDEVIDALTDSLELIDRAEQQADPRNPNQDSLFFGKGPVPA